MIVKGPLERPLVMLDNSGLVTITLFQGKYRHSYSFTYLSSDNPLERLFLQIIDSKYGLEYRAYMSLYYKHPIKGM